MEGVELKAARERAGLSLEEVSKHTRIPVKHLEAIEKGELHKLPAGPFGRAYLRQYRMLLGLSARAQVEDPAPEGRLRSRPRGTKVAAAPKKSKSAPEETESAPPFVLSPIAKQNLKGLALGAMILVTVVLVAWLANIVSTPAEVDIGEDPDQVVELRPTERVRVQVVADDRLLFDGALEPGAGGKSADGRTMTCKGGCRFEAHDRLEVAISNLSLVSLIYNERPLRPLGAQSRPRRLIFIDDSTER